MGRKDVGYQPVRFGGVASSVDRTAFTNITTVAYMLLWAVIAVPCAVLPSGYPRQVPRILGQ